MDLKVALLATLAEVRTMRATRRSVLVLSTSSAAVFATTGLDPFA
jgi:hypothetical protein